ncbi:MAG: phosphate ABC transporter ATP-binding protein [Candidatus Edwardsbacteria bacterium RIFOXYD12_FULL_50_11]|jgi:phosphate transport system ATP-binding protein|uniref:Phosphate ABC transporter ATP-binding protein n=1 Tax=Candidatus Edwardsbacteria bacterium GWF2_54_11 TaxID=1817851 RepID=A0A1F5R7W7_9BACT|nr:MAG: phosphate ABC transporter ATP-binding protein [Candidatus Edwardsbacteria bacterium RifOxyC12_full_54_24]OGF07734.1 MAG: phosphate ABC transporter ATP-binding protein [Candidatus Edwardsbacteria bacterium RifOxyA12_full_54_48]OGF09984.1 MAG: phosphate ABC transporter ATP-binding protein [Candidatus Edwardsbacteria bacterium GWE2_54_12]OGF10547.1 MAG: phosphate ABC transporter ATP-binding protein [Candidatus Edwardsbacteria bacterium GWF2_54_11]OGF14894.1 MAG: phosphate ABC transporter A
MNNKIEINRLNLYYGKFQALKAVDMPIRENSITALIGPSGCGKSTLLRCLNRMNDLIAGVRIDGRVLLDGRNIYRHGLNVPELRKRVGMVFQRPNPFPHSVFDNVAYGLKVAGISDKNRISETVERSLKGAWLWENLKDRLDRPALELPLDQQQRLCIARLLAVEPEVILMDEPCSALDPIATMKVEELMLDLCKRYTIAIVTHNMQQAARVSEYSGYMLLGDMVEFDLTANIFTNPRDARTQDYITGRYG